MGWEAGILHSFFFELVFANSQIIKKLSTFKKYLRMNLKIQNFFMKEQCKWQIFRRNLVSGLAIHFQKLLNFWNFLREVNGLRIHYILAKESIKSAWNIFKTHFEMNDTQFHLQTTESFRERLHSNLIVINYGLSVISQISHK